MSRRNRVVPIAGLAIALALLSVAIVSLSIGEHGPGAIEISGGEEAQRIFGGVDQIGDELGDPTAPVSIAVFNDIQCPSCAEWQLAVVPRLVDTLMRDGRVRLELRHYSAGPVARPLAAFGAIAAGEQGVQWQYAHLVAANLEQVPADGVDQEFLDAVAGAIVSAEFNAARWREAIDDPEVAERVDADEALATELRLPAGPSVIVEGARGEVRLEDSPAIGEIEAAVAEVE